MAMAMNSFDAPSAPQPFFGLLTQLFSRKDCLRLRGLPFESRIDAVVHFMAEFSPSIAPEGVHMVYTNHGQPAGEAFVQMDSEDAAFLAAMHLHHRYIMGRYIEVFQCSISDMNKLVTEAVAGVGPLGSHFGVYQQGTLPMLPPPGAIPPPSPVYFPPTAVYWPSQSLWSTSYYPNMAGVTMVLLRGLPYHATVQDILAFFHDFPNVTADSVNMQRDTDGRHNGEAIVAFPTRAEAEYAVRLKHLHSIGNRYIELLIA